MSPSRAFSGLNFFWLGLSGWANAGLAGVKVKLYRRLKYQMKLKSTDNLKRSAVY